jgi:hypothetical protein
MFGVGVAIGIGIEFSAVSYQPSALSQKCFADG